MEVVLLLVLLLFFFAAVGGVDVGCCFCIWTLLCHLIRTCSLFFNKGGFIVVAAFDVDDGGVVADVTGANYCIALFLLLCEGISSSDQQWCVSLYHLNKSFLRLGRALSSLFV
jgi:hypothetical protein